MWNMRINRTNEFARLIAVWFSFNLTAISGPGAWGELTIGSPLYAYKTTGVFGRMNVLFFQARNLPFFQVGIIFLHLK